MIIKKWDKTAQAFYDCLTVALRGFVNLGYFTDKESEEVLDLLQKIVDSKGYNKHI